MERGEDLLKPALETAIHRFHRFEQPIAPENQQASSSRPGAHAIVPCTEPNLIHLLHLWTSSTMTAPRAKGHHDDLRVPVNIPLQAEKMKSGLGPVHGWSVLRIMERGEDLLKPALETAIHRLHRFEQPIAPENQQASSSRPGAYGIVPCTEPNLIHLLHLWTSSTMTAPRAGGHPR
jgi:hypothetical protein